MKVIQAPKKLHYSDESGFKLFLAGSIEMGAAEQWQAKVISEFKDTHGVILNPRRDDWDSSWEQSMDNQQFSEQVVWELKGLSLADGILMYFDPKTKSPITLLELGLHAKNKNMIVCCPEGFWRKGNVDIVCMHYNIRRVDNLSAGIGYFKYAIAW